MTETSPQVHDLHDTRPVDANAPAIDLSRDLIDPDDLVDPADFSDHDDSRDRAHTPTTGELALSDRASLQRVAGLSTELTDVTEVEYRQLRLERVVLVGVWTEGSAAAAKANMEELAALAETAGSVVLEAVIQRRSSPDPATFIGSGKAQELRDVVAGTGADTVICDGELTPAQLTALEKVVKVKAVSYTHLTLPTIYSV